jgi:hypothetical protein
MRIANLWTDAAVPYAWPNVSEHGGGNVIMTTTYNHAYTIAFAVEGSTIESGEVDGATLRKAIIERLNKLDDDTLMEAVGLPFDTYIEQ